MRLLVTRRESEQNGSGSLRRHLPRRPRRQPNRLATARRLPAPRVVADRAQIVPEALGNGLAGLVNFLDDRVRLHDSTPINSYGVQIIGGS